MDFHINMENIYGYCRIFIESYKLHQRNISRTSPLTMPPSVSSLGAQRRRPRLLETKAASEEVPKMQDFQRLLQEARGGSTGGTGGRSAPETMGSFAIKK